MSKPESQIDADLPGPSSSPHYGHTLSPREADRADSRSQRTAPKETWAPALLLVGAFLTSTAQLGVEALNTVNFDNPSAVTAMVRKMVEELPFE